MAILRQHGGATISKPGAYTDIKVQNLTGFPLQPTGIIGIIGEALGGESGVLDVLSGPAIQAAKAKYKSGPIKDALSLLAAPSKDTRVRAGASKVVVYKVNNSTKATLKLKNLAAVDQFDVSSKNYGTDENTVSVLVSQGSVADANATLSGTVAGPFTLVGGETLILNANGTVYTYTGTLSGSQTAAALAADLDTGGNWSPSKPVVATEADGKIKLVLDGLGDLDYGYVTVDAASTLDTVIGVSGSKRGVKGTRFVTVVKGSLVEGKISEIGGLSLMKIKYLGGDCALTIQDSLGQRKLTTVCTTSADDLDLVLDKKTIQQVVDLIAANPAYQVSVSAQNGGQAATKLDYYTAIEVDGVDLDLKKDTQSFVDVVNLQSTLISVEKISNVSGAVANLPAPTLLAGAVDGTPTNSDWVAAVNAFKKVRINTLVPLISEDKGAVSVDTVNGAVASHVAEMWGTAGKSERNANVSKTASKVDLKSAAQAIASAYVSIFGQEPFAYSETEGENTYLEPWAEACLAAGMQAGSPVGEPITFKFANCSGLRVKDGSWDPLTDYQEMIEAGVTFLEPVDSGGFRFVVGNTTYGVDANFVWNRSSVVEAAGFVAYDMRQNLEANFTGTKAKTGSAENVAAFITQRMEVYLGADIIVGDDNNSGKGFKDLRVTLEGNTALVDVTVTPVQGIDFILPTIYLADIRQSA